MRLILEIYNFASELKYLLGLRIGESLDARVTGGRASTFSLSSGFKNKNASNLRRISPHSYKAWYTGDLGFSSFGQAPPSFSIRHSFCISCWEAPPTAFPDKMASKLSLVGAPQSERAQAISSPQTIGANGTLGALSQGQSSGSNSPKIVPGRPTHLDATPEDEDYRPAQDNDEEESDETLNRQYGHSSTNLPEAALGMDEATDTTPPETEEGMLPRDVQEKTAYYDYTSEKQLSQADAKLFYQRSKLESQKPGDASWSTSQWGTRQNSPHESPVLIPNSMSNFLERDQAGMKSSGSMTSIQGGRNVPQR